ncbi:YceK/YidQ family lipoprotein [Leptospira andrefontaineae]|uniref:YceK/YidQ family lipoprotein n=1 Tax=Leptospira andrefontaineae TaxID=2484976 RepID=A0A4R9GXK8_9LEPT|nr:YceK/YidQ family lipoprotein [Leptospira andrefontaineae]
MKIINSEWRQILELISILLIFFSSLSCATFHSIDSRVKGNCDITSKQSYQVLYGGTKLNIHFITADTTRDRGGYAKLAAWFGMLDFIPSFLMDTVLVPVTIPWEVAGLYSDTKCKETK